VTLRFDPATLRAVRDHGERAYPDEGAGLLLGHLEADDIRHVTHWRPLENRWDAAGRKRRYQLDPRDLMRIEDDAERDGLAVLGVFHSHPDHPPRPSAFDLEHALPYYSYLITSVDSGAAGESRAWRLADDRSEFAEEAIQTADRQEDLR
jgi:proteasome lid subunit RPN8/RPN11